MRLLYTDKKPTAPDVLTPVLKGLIHTAVVLWPLLALLLLIGVGKVCYELYLLSRLSRSGIGEIDRMDGRTFEVFLGTLFRRLGYRVEVTRFRGDYGADLVVVKGGRRTAVQAKRWSKRVGVKAIQEAVASKGYYNCDDALVVASRAFTPQARLLARANNVQLWDRDDLVSKLLARKPERPEVAREAEDLPGAGVEDSPGAASGVRCVVCGVSVSEKVREYCESRPGRFGGFVYCFRHQRTRPLLPPARG